MAIPIKIGKAEFASQAALKKAMLAILNESPINAALTEHREFLTGCLQRHYNKDEKIGCGVDRFEVRFHRAKKNANVQRAFFVIRTDGSFDSFSYKPCLTGEPPPYRDQVAQAARYAVAEDVHTFKRQYFAGRAQPVCAECGGPLSSQRADVDHAGEWPFQRILDEWCSSLGDRYWHIPLKKITASFAFGTEAAAEHFRKFHNRRATLRVTCGPCNGPGTYRSTFAPPKKNGES